MFEAPAGYTLLGGKQRDGLREEEEDLLQFAIQQSLLEAGSEYDQVGAPTTLVQSGRSGPGAVAFALLQKSRKTSLKSVFPTVRYD